MSDPANTSLPTLPLPSRTLVKQSGGQELFWFDGLLVLPLGARIKLAAVGAFPEDGVDPEQKGAGDTLATVLGVSVSGSKNAGGYVVLEVDMGGIAAAIEEALAETEVVDAAEEIVLSEASSALPDV